MNSRTIPSGLPLTDADRTYALVKSIWLRKQFNLTVEEIASLNRVPASLVEKLLPMIEVDQ